MKASSCHLSRCGMPSWARVLVWAAFAWVPGIGADTSASARLPSPDALDPPQRLRAILRDSRDYPGMYVNRNPALEALRQVPGWADMLAVMARDTADTLRKPAIGAAIRLGIPDLARILRDEIARPMPPIRPVRQHIVPLSGWKGFQGDGWKRFLPSWITPFPKPILGRRGPGSYWADSRFEEEYHFRGALIRALAELDDPTSSPLLASMLFDPESPTGYALAQIDRIGLRQPHRYGIQNWGAGRSPDNAFSHCLQSPGGRPGTHAAAYRALARVGGPYEVAALGRFDAETSGPGGWARLCDGDDGLRRKFHRSKVAPAGLGLCQGWDVGNIRVTQAGAIWFRKRLHGGAWGPPAWAFDPGGDDLLRQSVVISVRRADEGGIRIEGYVTYYGDPWNTTLDPRRVFADQDGDGLTDGTEKALGTDPGRADTDGDGFPDGKDPAPKAPAVRNDSDRVQGEVVRYLTIFAMGGPIGLYADSALWSGGSGARGAGVIVHWPRLDRPGTDCKEYGDCDFREPGPKSHPGIRRCEEPLAIRTLSVATDLAEVVAAWPSGHRIARRFLLAKVAGDWRVIRDEEGDLAATLTRGGKPLGSDF